MFNINEEKYSEERLQGFFRVSQLAGCLKTAEF
jgi:hypothetical protein